MLKPSLKLVETSLLDNAQKEGVLLLWNQEYPVELAYVSIQELDVYLAKLITPRHVLLYDEDGTLLVWYADFDRDRDRWFAMIIHPAAQGLGIGTFLLEQARKLHSELHGWVIDHHFSKKSDGSVYRSPIVFYLKNGFEVMPHLRLETERLSAVNVRWRRT